MAQYVNSALLVRLCFLCTYYKYMRSHGMSCDANNSIIRVILSPIDYVLLDKLHTGSMMQLHLNYMHKNRLIHTDSFSATGLQHAPASKCMYTLSYSTATMS
jgi:hypothetical protein